MRKSLVKAVKSKHRSIYWKQSGSHGQTGTPAIKHRSTALVVFTFLSKVTELTISKDKQYKQMSMKISQSSGRNTECEDKVSFC